MNDQRRFPYSETHPPADHSVVITIPRRELEIIAGALKAYADELARGTGQDDGKYIQRLANKLEVAAKKPPAQ
jgi:hypothetical protein